MEENKRWDMHHSLIFRENPAQETYMYMKMLTVLLQF